MDANIQSIDRFDIKKAENGFTISVEFYPKPTGGITWSSKEYTTLVAKNLKEVNVLMAEWFGKLEAV